MNDDLNGRQSRDWDEGENATGRRFHPRSNENKKSKERAMPRRATPMFSEGQRTAIEKEIQYIGRKTYVFQPQSKAKYEDAKGSYTAKTV